MALGWYWEALRGILKSPPFVHAEQDLDIYSSPVIGMMYHPFHIELERTDFHQCALDLHTRRKIGSNKRQPESCNMEISYKNCITKEIKWNSPLFFLFKKF